MMTLTKNKIFNTHENNLYHWTEMLMVRRKTTFKYLTVIPMKCKVVKWMTKHPKKKSKTGLNHRNGVDGPRGVRGPPAVGHPVGDGIEQTSTQTRGKTNLKK